MFWLLDKTPSDTHTLSAAEISPWSHGLLDSGDLLGLCGYLQGFPGEGNQIGILDSFSVMIRLTG